MVKYYMREINDFGEYTEHWIDVSSLVNNKLPEHTEYVIAFSDGSHVWNRCKDNGRISGFPTFEETVMDKRWFDTIIKPYIKHTEKYMNPESEEKFPGWIREMVKQVAREEVLAAIARHERTKIDVSDYVFEIGQKVLKHTGDYHAEGTVIGRFKMLNGAVRYAVEHNVPPSGSFIHLYSEKNLKISNE